MRIFALFLFILFWSHSPMLKAEENFYNDDISQLRSLNSELTEQLSSATQEINKLQLENYKLKISDEIQKELIKTQKELENKSYEVRVLRQKLMISKDEKNI